MCGASGLQTPLVRLPAKRRPQDRRPTVPVKLIVISPEHDDSREHAVLEDLFAAGLERYHVRKPSWSREQLEAWLRALPREWRARLVLHSHHELVGELGLGGVHFRDEVGRVVPNPPLQDPFAPVGRRVGDNAPYRSRSCHDLATLRAALGRCDAVFFAPVFPSLSKPGRAPAADFPFAALAAVLATRTDDERRTSVLALGGITSETAPRALALGFDGVAALGAIWQAADPARAFAELRSALGGDGRPARPSATNQASESTGQTRGPRVAISSTDAA